MIKKFEKHLTTLFFSMTSVILTLVLVLVFFYQVKLDFSRKQELFHSQLLDLTHQLEGTSSFSDEWLSNLEYNGHLIIHIEDQGTPLFYRGIWTPKTERSKLIALAKEKALQEGIDTDIKHYSRSLSQSSIFKIKGEHQDTYLGTVLVLSQKSFSLTCAFGRHESNISEHFLSVYLLSRIGNTRNPLPLSSQ